MTPTDPAQPSFAIVTGKTVHEIIFADVPGVVRRVEAAYLAHHRGQTINPDSYFLRFPDTPSARIIALPAHLAGTADAGASASDAAPAGLSGIKWIASYPDNLALGIPRASAVLILNDGRTGYPFACLEASIISAARTAASAASGARHLNHGRTAADTLAIIGTGLIARFVVTFLINTGWRIGRIVLYDRAPDYAAAFQRRLAADHGLAATVAPSDDATVRQSDLIVLTTTAGVPYLTDPAAFAHAPLVLNISLRDLGAEVILGAHNVVDDVDHCLKANTSPHLAEQKTGNRDFIFGTLPAILDGGPVPDRSKPVVFSPFGMGILDLAVGQFVYDAAHAAGAVIDVPDFFCEMQRL